MSHEATSWVLNEVDGLKPTAFSVLMRLADCHSTIRGCFPSQHWLAENCNISLRSVRDHLNPLESPKIICRKKRGSSRSGKQQWDWYLLAFEAEFETAMSIRFQPKVSGNSSQISPAKPEQTQRQELPPSLVKEPIKKHCGASHPNQRQAAFELFWGIYPRTRNRDRTAELFNKALDGHIDPERITRSEKIMLQRMNSITLGISSTATTG